MKNLMLFKKLVYSTCLIIMFSCSAVAQNQNKPYAPSDPVWTTQSDIVDMSGGCYTINVRVYLTDNGTTYLEANSNVQIGTCPRPATNINPICKEQEFKGDFFISSKDNYKYCVLDLLQDEVLYAKYVIEKNRLINSIKK